MKLRFKSLMLMLLVTLPLLTSCFSESDVDNTHDFLNPSETTEYLKKMQGSYKGKFYYAYIGKGGSMQLDSIDNIDWTLTEGGELKISKLPVSKFAHSLRSGSMYDFLADEVEKCDDISFEAKITPFRTHDGWIYPFAITPKENIVLNLKKDNKNYKLVLYYHEFVSISKLYYRMEGECHIHQNRMYITLPIGSSTVNEVETGAMPSLFRYNGIRPEQSKK